MVKKHKNIQNTWVLWPGIFAKTQKHIKHMGGVTWEVEVYKQKNTKTYGARWFCVHWSEEKIQKHTKHMTCSSIFFMLKKNTKTRKIQRGFPVLFGPHHTLTKKPKKYKKNKPNKTSPQYCLLAHLHQGVKKYKNTLCLTIFFLVFVIKKTQNYIKHKRHIWSFSDSQRAISTYIISLML